MNIKRKGLYKHMRISILVVAFLIFVVLFTFFVTPASSFIGQLIAHLVPSSSSPSSPSSPSVIVKTVPVQLAWRADGVTEYQMNVYADNTELNPETTKSATWQIVKPAGLEPYIIITRAEWPSANDDFFNGFSTFFQTLGANWNAHGKVVNGNGPANKNGILASYWFKINPGFVGQTNFDINPDNTDFGDSQANPQFFSIENTAFTVLSNDTIPPVVTLVSIGFGDAVSSPEVNFGATFTDNEALASATLYVWDSGNNVIFQQSVPLSGLSGSADIPFTLPSGGTYHWNYQALDAANNMAFALDNSSVTYTPSDVTPPNVVINAPLNITYNVTSLTFSVDLNENGTVQYSLNNGITNVTMTSSDGLHFTSPATLGNGVYTFRVYATDVAGNANNTAKVTFSVNTDVTPPKVTISAPLNITYNVSSIIFKVLLNEQGSEVKYSLDNGVTNVTMARSANNKTFTRTASVNNGAYTFRAYAKDLAGNQNNTAKVSFTMNAPQKRVFVTSFTIPNPNFINPSGADAYCTQAKTQAGLNGTFIAWVSFNGTNAKDRVLDMKYVRMDGATVASSKSDLVDGSVANPVSLDQYGNGVPAGSFVMTGTKDNGFTATNICNNWQGITNTSTKKGALGNAFYTNKSWTYSQTAALCKNMFNTQRLYCFEI